MMKGRGEEGREEGQGKKPQGKELKISLFQNCASLFLEVRGVLESGDLVQSRHPCPLWWWGSGLCTCLLLCDGDNGIQYRDKEVPKSSAKCEQQGPCCRPGGSKGGYGHIPKVPCPPRLIPGQLDGRPLQGPQRRLWVPESQ